MRFEASVVLVAFQKAIAQVIQSRVRSLFERMKCPEKAQQTEIIVCLGVFLFSIGLCWLFSLAYPQAFITEETACHRALSQSFKLFQANALDWSITFPFSLLLWLTAHSPFPTNATYWLNAILFSLNMAAIFILGRLVFNSLLAGIGLALSSIAFEICMMRIFYCNLQVCVDPLLSEVICFGILLAMIAWLVNRPRLFLAAYAVLGWGCFLKPVGLSLVPMLIPFAIWAWFRLPEKRQKTFTIALSLCLLLGPAFLWSVRNYFVYGAFKCSALSGSSLLRATMPLVEYGDRVLDDPVISRKFIEAVRTCERVEHYPREIDIPQPIRSWRNEEYFICGDCPVNPFVVLSDSYFPGWTGIRYCTPKLNPPLLFNLDAICGPMAVRIILAHPLGYIHRFAREYIDLFNPSVLALDPWDKFDGNPLVDYLYWKPRVGPPPVDFELSPGRGFPSGHNSNAAVANAFLAVYSNPIVSQFRAWFFANELVISHLIFLGALALLIFRHSHRYNRNLALVLIILFVTADLPDIAVAMCQVAKARYALLGELEIHLAFLITAFALVQWLVWLAKNTSGISLSRLFPMGNTGNLHDSMQRHRDSSGDLTVK